MENDYEVISTLGEGSFGKVYKARHRRTAEEVAVKQIKIGSRSFDEACRSAELQALKALRHPFIVKLKELIRSQWDGSLYYIFEFLDSDLCRLVKDNPSGLEELRAGELMRQLFAGLTHMHQHNFFHRDIKPENVLLDARTESIRLADFGQARSLRARPPFTDYVGTRWYRAPECLLRDGTYSSPVDVWASGLIFSEMLRGSPVFCGTSSIDQLYKIFTVLGYPLNEWPDFARLAQAMRFRVPDRSGCGVGRMLPSKISQQCQTVVSEILQINPRRRPFARKCLENPFFNQLPSLDIDGPETPSSRVTEDQLDDIESLIDDRSSSMDTVRPAAVEATVDLDLDAELDAILGDGGGIGRATDLAKAPNYEVGGLESHSSTSTGVPSRAESGPELSILFKRDGSGPRRAMTVPSITVDHEQPDAVRGGSCEFSPSSRASKPAKSPGGDSVNALLDSLCADFPSPCAAPCHRSTPLSLEPEPPHPPWSLPQEDQPLPPDIDPWPLPVVYPEVSMDLSPGAATTAVSEIIETATAKQVPQILVSDEATSDVWTASPVGCSSSAVVVGLPSHGADILEARAPTVETAWPCTPGGNSSATGEASSQGSPDSPQWQPSARLSASRIGAPPPAWGTPRPPLPDSPGGASSASCASKAETEASSAYSEAHEFDLPGLSFKPLVAIARVEVDAVFANSASRAAGASAWTLEADATEQESVPPEAVACAQSEEKAALVAQEDSMLDSPQVEVEFQTQAQDRAVPPRSSVPMRTVLRFDDTAVDREDRQFSRKGTGFVHAGELSDDETDEHRVHFNEPEGHSENKMVRQGTGFVRDAELPEDSDGDSPHAHFQESDAHVENKIVRSGTGFVHAVELPDSPHAHVQESDGHVENKIVRNGTGFVHAVELPDSPHAHFQKSDGHSNNRIVRKGTGFVHSAELPDEPHAHFQESQDHVAKKLIRKGTGFVLAHDMLSEDRGNDDPAVCELAALRAENSALRNRLAAEARERESGTTLADGVATTPELLDSTTAAATSEAMPSAGAGRTVVKPRGAVWTSEEAAQLRRLVKRVMKKGTSDKEALWVEVSSELANGRSARECKLQYARDYRAHKAKSAEAVQSEIAGDQVTSAGGFRRSGELGMLTSTTSNAQRLPPRRLEAVPEPLFQSGMISQSAM